MKPTLALLTTLLLARPKICPGSSCPGTLFPVKHKLDDSTLLNPAFVVKNRGDANLKLTLDGKVIPRGKGFRYGHRRTLEGTDLIVWIKTETQASLHLRLEAQ